MGLERVGLEVEPLISDSIFFEHRRLVGRLPKVHFLAGMAGFSD